MKFSPKPSTLLVALGFSLAIFLAPHSHAIEGEFKDVPADHPFYADIMMLKTAGVINGYEDGTFRPDAPVDRAAALKIIFGLKSGEIAEATQAPFPDVDPSQWFAKYVSAAKKAGIVKGNPDGTYRPGSPVDKASFITMLLKTNGIDVSKHNNAKFVANDVPDDAWFKPYLSYTKTLGVTMPAQGGDLNPGQQLNRGQVAAYMARLVRVLQGGDTQKNLSIAEAKLIEAINMLREKNVDGAEAATNQAVAAANQALHSKPDETVVQGAAKITEAFQKLVISYKLGLAGNFSEAISYARAADEAATQGASTFEGVKAIADQITNFAAQVASEAQGKEDTAQASILQEEEGKKAEQITLIKNKMAEITGQYQNAMSTLQAELDKLQ